LTGYGAPQFSKKQENFAMIPEKLLEIMKQDGVVAIATSGKDGARGQGI
jgi:hypothetical protein